MNGMAGPKTLNEVPEPARGVAKPGFVNNLITKTPEAPVTDRIQVSTQPSTFTLTTTTTTSLEPPTFTMESTPFPKPSTAPFVVNIITTSTTPTPSAPPGTVTSTNFLIQNTTESAVWSTANASTQSTTEFGAGSTANFSGQTTTSSVVGSLALNGFPALCSESAVDICSNTTLKDCSQCSMVGAGFFGFFVVLLALAVIVANFLVIWFFLKEKSMFTGSYSKIKASLAVADMLTGILLFAVALPNFLYTINSTPDELLRYTISLQQSPLAVAGGVFYILIYTSSLYHLVFLGQQRLFAVRWPIRYKHQADRNVYIGLAAVWSLSILCAFAPLWFPGIFEFGYQQLIFLFNLTLSATRTVTNYTPLIVMVVIVFILPYLLMSVLTIATGFFVAKHLRKSAKLSSSNAESKKEFVVFATMAVMQLGFTITLVPLVVVVIMSYTGDLNTTNISTPYIVCFYLSMSNSLVNVFVYSAVDSKFRKSVREIFCACSPSKLKSPPPSSKTNNTFLSKHPKSHTKSQTDSV